ncbi:NAD(P)/FAD-dependent oxidoreductase [Phaeobacter marinintestinus]|uniref:NAD(P)/FAD-dependent oxidoreductase n=1 Tax=Falsiphaeobacter marinintestinus TaxID=1492905 RepID=UPI0011B77D10|nr:FAD-dependent oxidoreductase [Phaeobacter marinintestinus]
MKRIFPPYTYGPGPRAGCWWDDTIAAPDWPVYGGGTDVDVAIVGGGFTGLSAAYHLATTGASVAVLEAQSPGWGASGRNGGFCCLGGAKLSPASMKRTYGSSDTAVYQAAESAAIDLVAELLDRLDIDADIHSKGETELAHSPRAMAALRKEAEAMSLAGETPDLIEKADLDQAGFGGPFLGALTRPEGFGLNPRKYLFGLSNAAQTAGAEVYQQTEVQRIARRDGRFALETSFGQLTASKVVVATNGYSSEDLPKWLAGRYLPAQSTVLVTRPLTDDELAAQGWTSDQMAFDTRNLLHYFRLMPDRRFLFGMRGGLMSSPSAEHAARKRTRADFDKMFPAWRAVPSTHTWSGMVCLARNRVPFVGPVPEQPGVFAGLAFHGNGVAMGSYSGRLLADLAMEAIPDLPYPSQMRQPMARFPLGRARRVIMPALYGALKLGDL